MRHVIAGLAFRGSLILMLSFTTASAQSTAQINGTVRDHLGG